jgi:PAS domain S-box-containing protein
MELDCRLILDTFADAVVVANAAGEILYANPTVHKLLGWSGEELVGQPLTALIPERLQHAHCSGLQRYLATRQPQLLGRPVRVPVLRKDGSEAAIELNLAAIDASGQEVFVASLRDVAERVELERQLAVGRYLRATAEAAAQFSSCHDLQKLLDTFVTTLVEQFDAALARVWLYEEASETLRLQASAGLSTSTATSSRAHLDVRTSPFEAAEVARTRVPYVRNGLLDDPHFEREWVRREGLASAAVIPLLAAGELRGVVSYFSRRELLPEVADVLAAFGSIVAAAVNDVLLFHRERAARAQAEEAVRERDRVLQALRESEAQFRLLVEQSPQSIQVLDPEGWTLQVNPAWERLWELRLSDLQHYNMLQDPQLIEKGVMPYIRKGFAGEAAEVPPILYDRAKSLPDVPEIGEPERWVRSVIYPIRNATGQITKVVLIHEDYTVQMHLEKQLRQRVAELAEADRRKDEFIATLAHELRNPLAAISSSIYLLDRLGSQELRPTQLRKTIFRQTAYLARLVDDLLDVSRISRGLVELKQEQLDLREVLRRLTEPAPALIEARQHTLSLRLPDEAVPVTGDPIRLEQVFTNLLTNAAKYTDPGGALSLTLDVERVEGRGENPQTPALAAGLRPPPPAPSLQAVVRVRDTGIGIDPEILPHIFDLFFQVDRSHARTHGGLGIGLNMVRRLVELHGGTVEAHSEGPGRGSEFVVRLPLARDARSSGVVNREP